MTLKTITALSFALILVSCSSQQVAPSAVAFLDVPVHIVEIAKQSMPHLRKGMSDAEALEVLGLSAYRRQMLVSSGGSPSNWHNDYLLRSGYCLTLHSDGHGLARATLAGSVWP